MKDNNMGQTLIKAIKADDVEKVRKILMDKVDIHIENDLPIRWAVKNGYTDIVKTLLDQGAKTHIHHMAKHGGYTEIAYTEIAYTEIFEEYLLTTAIEKNYPEIVKLLLEHGATLSSSSDIAHIWDNRSTEILKLMFEYNMIDLTNIDGLFSRAVTNASMMWPKESMDKSIEFLEVLLDHGVNINRENNISRLRDRGNLALVEFLLNQGADVRIGGNNVYLNLVAEKDILKALLDAGGNPRNVGYNLNEFVRTYQRDNPDLTDEEGRTNLMRIAQNGPTYKLREYLTRTTNIDKQDNLGNTALIYAIQSDDPLRVKVLLEYNANPFIANYSIDNIPGANAWDYAQVSTNPKIKELFQPFNKEGQLHLAMRERQVPRDVQTLMRHYRS